jgi:hypothetical protein
MTLVSTKSVTEIDYHESAGVKVRQARKADNLTAIYEPVV